MRDIDNKLVEMLDSIKQHNTEHPLDETKSFYGIDYIQIVKQESEKHVEEAASLTKRLLALRYQIYNEAKYEIATILLHIQRNQLYDVFASGIYEYAEKVLGFKRVTTASYLNVARKLLKEDEPKTRWGTTDFKMTHLSEMCKFLYPDLMEYINQGIIYPQISVDKLKSLLKQYKEGKLKSTQDRFLAILNGLDDLKKFIVYPDGEKLINDITYEVKALHADMERTLK